jgi:phosphoglycerol transferase MdoB-like AlkP superfamily enzyme
MPLPTPHGARTAFASLVPWLALLAALWALNLALSFHNVWPTPWVTTRHELSVEAALLALALAAWVQRRGLPSRRVLHWIAVVLVLLCLGRYAAVTSPALYGRPINLYWDAPHLPQVAAMLARAAPVWTTAAALAACVVVPLLLYGALRLALAGMSRALAHPAPRRALLLASTAVLALFAFEKLHGPLPAAPRFSEPVTSAYAQQAALLADAVLGSPARAALERQPPLPGADLARLGGADVLLVFVESYGATAFARREHRAALADAHDALADAVTASGRQVVSAFVRSPTFGGASWLAHASLLSGQEVADAATYAALLTGDRDTLVQRFAARGYRAVALMPGIKRAWPEGSFYRYAHLYDAARLDYRGPDFGWWAIPDQYALAVLDARELAASPRAPLFAVFPTISTHMPFLPAPPYQPDWERLLGGHPFDARVLAASLARQPDWSDLSPAYVHAMSYALNTLAGYVARVPTREQVLVVLGDHQPAASISGAQAGREVPVHVIASRGELLRDFLAAGFEPGLTPTRAALMPLHALAPLLLQAFSDELPAMAR